MTSYNVDFSWFFDLWNFAKFFGSKVLAWFSEFPFLGLPHYPLVFLMMEPFKLVEKAIGMLNTTWSSVEQWAIAWSSLSMSWLYAWLYVMVNLLWKGRVCTMFIVAQSVESCHLGVGSITSYDVHCQGRIQESYKGVLKMMLTILAYWSWSESTSRFRK